MAPQMVDFIRASMSRLMELLYGARSIAKIADNAVIITAISVILNRYVRSERKG
jgi:hypothetical protein